MLAAGFLPDTSCWDRKTNIISTQDINGDGHNDEISSNDVWCDDGSGSAETHVRLWTPDGLQELQRSSSDHDQRCRERAL